MRVELPLMAGMGVGATVSGIRSPMTKLDVDDRMVLLGEAKPSMLVLPRRIRSAVLMNCDLTMVSRIKLPCMQERLGVPAACADSFVFSFSFFTSLG